jgi:hypothetical protein
VRVQLSPSALIVLVSTLEMKTPDKREKLVVATKSGIRIEVKASAEDMKWLRPLFTRHTEPHRVLRDMGYEMMKSVD